MTITDTQAQGTPSAPEEQRIITDARIVGVLGLQAPAACQRMGSGSSAVTAVWDENGSVICASGPAAVHLSLLGRSGRPPSRAGYSMAAPVLRGLPAADLMSAAEADATLPIRGETPSAWWQRVGTSRGWLSWLRDAGLTSDAWADWAALAKVVDPTSITDAVQERLKQREQSSLSPSSASDGTPLLPPPVQGGDVLGHEPRPEGGREGNG